MSFGSPCLDNFGTNGSALMNWAGMELILLGYMSYGQMLQVYNLVLFTLTFGTALLDFSTSCLMLQKLRTDLML